MGMNRGQKIEFNFDSLTDCITNLAGSLILVTLIIFGLTKPKESGEMQPGYEKVRVGGDTSMDPLVHELEVMRNDMQKMRRELGGFGEQLPQIACEVEELEQRSKTR